MRNTHGNIRVSTLVDCAHTQKTLGEVLGLIDQMKQDPMYAKAEFFLDGSKRAVMMRL